jgi:hypothetical protein
MIVLPAETHARSHGLKLIFTCPENLETCANGIKTDVQTLSAAWSAKIKVDCPLCGGSNETAVREAFLDLALAGAFERPVGPGAPA